MQPTATSSPSIQATFRDLRARGRIGLLPFIPAGFPDLATTAACLPALSSAGASAIEVGFPFSDPIADGPVIQEAFTAALVRKLKVADVFGTIASVRGQVAAPLIAMVSYSIVFRYGIERFAADARSAGFDGLIMPDLPPPEAQRTCQTVRAAGLDTILLIAPTTAPDRRRDIAALCSGFVYYLSVSGITGERANLPPDVAENVRAIKRLTDVPVCVGFGVSRPEHVAQLGGVADGAIVGTAYVRRMQRHLPDGPDRIAAALADYTRELLAHV